MMEEIGRRPGGGGGGEFGAASNQGSAVSQDREGYALAAGLALGLITLGKGRLAVGLSDLHIEERLRYIRQHVIFSYCATLVAETTLL